MALQVRLIVLEYREQQIEQQCAYDLTLVRVCNALGHHHSPFSLSSQYAALAAARSRSRTRRFGPPGGYGGAMWLTSRARQRHPNGANVLSFDLAHGMAAHSGIG